MMMMMKMVMIQEEGIRFDTRSIIRSLMMMMMMMIRRGRIRFGSQMNYQTIDDPHWQWMGQRLWQSNDGFVEQERKSEWSAQNILGLFGSDGRGMQAVVAKKQNSILTSDLTSGPAFQPIAIIIQTFESKGCPSKKGGGGSNPCLKKYRSRMAFYHKIALEFTQIDTKRLFQGRLVQILGYI